MQHHIHERFNELASQQPQDANAPRYYMHFSDTADTQRILDFYDMNAHQNVLKRDIDRMKAHIDSGDVILVEDEKGKIVAASITYAHKGHDKNGNEQVMWQEIGTTRAVLNGYPGLFDAMVTMQTLRAYLVEPPEDRFVAHMITAPLQAMANKLGWRQFQPPDELLDAKAKTMGKKQDKQDWYQCGMEGLPVMARYMMRAVDNPVLTNKKTGERIILDFSRSTFFKNFSGEIASLAKRDLGNPDKPDAARSVAASSRNFLKSRFR